MRALLPYLALLCRHKWRLFLGIVLAIATLLASIGLLTLSGWFLSASALAGLAGLYSFNYMLPAAGVRGAAIIRTAGRYFERLVSHDATFRVLQHLRVFTFSKLLPLSPARLGRFQQGELLNRLVADVDSLDHLYLRVISPLVGAFVVILVVTFGLSWLNGSLALILGAILLATLLILPTLFYFAGRRNGETLTVLRGNYRQQLTLWLQHHAELTLFGAASRYRQQLDTTEYQWQDAQRQQTELSAAAQAMMVLTGGLAVVVMLWLVEDGFDVSHSPRALVALFVFCTMAAFEALTPVTVAFQHLGQVIAAAQRVTQLTEQKPEVTFASTPHPVPHQIALEIEDVNFSYPDRPQNALTQVSLNVAAGEHIVILGRTGCGKSTLLQLLTRAWDPQSGEIRINGSPLSEFDEPCLRATMSVVPQRIHLFSATLRDNLLLAAPQASDTQLTSLLEQVGLSNLLLDAGLNSWLGEGGRQLSGGELRRLAIARTLLHNAPLMLLDEPTEGLDAETEQQIMALLLTVAQGKTLLMVTHRLRGLGEFDRIIVMDNGQIIEQGHHTALINARGRYYQFCQRV